jgi:cytochrome P450
MASGNRDPRRYDDPDVYNVLRDDVQHLTFGYGVHFCLGAPLARAEATIALSRLFDRFPRMRLAVPESDLLPLPSIMGNGHQTLPVLLDAAE